MRSRKWSKLVVGREEIAFAQNYFTVQTRKQEIIEERIAFVERAEARGRFFTHFNDCAKELSNRND